MHKLIVNSDDFGYSRGVNHAIIDTHTEGILTSATLMANTPGFNHAVELAKKNKRLGVGVHLVLTFLKPLEDDVPSLTDENGNFYHLNDYRVQKHQVNPDDLYKEWDRQIQKVINAGINPTHLDSHHHSHTFNQIHLDVFLTLANKYNLPTRGIAGVNKLEHGPKTTSYFENDFDQIANLSTSDQEVYLNNLFSKIKTNESTELMCHVGYLDEFLLSTSSFTDLRVYQINILSNSHFAERIRSDKEIQLGHFGDL